MATRFEVRAADSYAVCGPLTFDTVTAVWPQGVAALRGPGPVHIDLSQVSRTDSAGLALLGILTMAAVHRTRWGRA